MWIIDFGVDMQVEAAARYERPFDHVCRNVRPEREKNKRQSYRKRWWIHVEPRPAMRKAFLPIKRFLGTTTVSKHRLFVWFEAPILPDHQLIVLRNKTTSSSGCCTRASTRCGPCDKERSLRRGRDIHPAVASRRFLFRSQLPGRRPPSPPPRRNLTNCAAAG